MELTNFIAGLINEGKVKVVPQLLTFTAEDLQLAGVHLRQYYEDDAQEMPADAPDFDLTAACWAAGYLYRAVQFILIRELDETTMQQQLLPYAGEHSPAAVYSADLTLRYLPDLFDLAKGLSPHDPLVKQMQTTAQDWPFSAASIPLDTMADVATVMSHASLRQAYIDRIIYAKDLRKCRQPECYPLVQEALGSYADIFWPQLEPDWVTEEQQELVAGIVNAAIAKAELHPQQHAPSSINSTPDADAIYQEIKQMTVQWEASDTSGAERALIKDRLRYLNGRCEWIGNEVQRNYVLQPIEELWQKIIQTA